MKAILALCLLLSSFAVMAENKITLFVTLTPAGSFQAVSNKAKGNLFKQGDVFTADKISVSIESFNKVVPFVYNKIQGVNNKFSKIMNFKF